MNPLKPLLFLSFRSIVNGVKRALTSPRRLIIVLATVLYYFSVFIRPAMFPGRAPRVPHQFVGLVQFPPMQVLEAVVFGIFSTLSLLLLVSVLSYQGSFKASDVDVLFPTPISPKLVLAFKMLRDYFITLVFPFFIALLGARGAKSGWETLFNSMPHPEYSGLVLRAMTVSWVLIAMGWVSLSYAASLFTNRSDSRSDFNKRVMTTAIVAIILGTVGYLVWRIREMQGWEELIGLAHSPYLHIAFFPATFGTLLTMAPFYGSATMALEAFAGMIAVIVVGLSLTFAQVGWLYDQAAAKGFKAKQARQMHRSGDLMGYAAEMARSGKAKPKRRTFLHRLKMEGAKALVWKELFIQPRSMFALLLMFTLTGMLFSALPSMLATSDKDETAMGILLLMMQGCTTAMISLFTGQVGFIEVLKRVDLQKPLPFTPGTIVFAEVASKAAFAIISAWIGDLVALALTPQLWRFIVSGAIFMPFLAIMLTSAVFFVTMLFPDVEDPSQRQFRGLMIMLGFVICSFFPLATYIGLAALQLSPIIGAVVAGFLALGIGLALSAFGGQLYATFNPSE